MKRKMISKIMAAALIGTMCAGMAVPVMAADDEKVTLSVINYHVGTDYAAEYYSYLFEASYLQRRSAGYRFQWWKQHYRAGCKIRKSSRLDTLPGCRSGVEISV